MTESAEKNFPAYSHLPLVTWSREPFEQKLNAPLGSYGSKFQSVYRNYLSR